MLTMVAPITKVLFGHLVEDEGGQYKFVGENCSDFIRLISNEVGKVVPFHYTSWQNVPDQFKKAIFPTLFDLISGFREQPVDLTFNSCYKLYHEVISRCTLLHGRYMSTPWLSSPHLETTFLRFFGRQPVFNYRREILDTGDGGIVALDWLARFDDKWNSAISSYETSEN
ncbi:hypothetical protein R6Q59_027802 [Mikania micrantha]